VRPLDLSEGGKLFYHENNYILENDLAKAFTWKEVHLPRFFHNLEMIRRISGNEKVFLIPIKANAYGHGMVGIAKATEAKLKKKDLTGEIWLGVANLMEGVTLRKFGVKLPVLVLGPMRPDLIDYYSRYNLKASLTSLSELNSWLEIYGRSGKGNGKTPGAHIKFDTGMGRLGILSKDFEKALGIIKEYPNFSFDGVYSHLATADAPGDFHTEAQIELFSLIKERIIKFGIRVKYWHLANSGGTLNYPASHFNLIRPGISLYGYYPSIKSGKKLEARGILLKPVMEIKSRVSAVKELPKGHGISYGRTFITKGNTKTSLVPVGYGDGFARILSNGWHVLFRGKKYPVRGRVSMDQIVIERDKAGPNLGDEVIILGEDGKCRLWADAWAQKLHTISYEVLCGFSQRVPILYINE
jgi:alanine racemase